MGEDETPLEEDRASLLGRLGGSPGLCARCLHLRLLAGKRSVFVRCGKADSDPRFVRYPGLPVRECSGFEESDSSATLKP